MTGETGSVPALGDLLRDRSARLWDHLTAPSAAIEEPEMRRRARMLAGLLLFLVFAAFLLTLVIPWIVAPSEHQANRILAATGLGVIGVGLSIYVVSRTRHFETAAWLATFATLASVTFSMYTAQGTIWQDGAPFYLALSTILATLLLPLVAAGFVVVMCLFLPVVFYHTIPTFTAVGLSNATMFLGITSALLLVTALVRHFDIRQIHAQADALCESEERYRTLFEASFEGLALHTDGRILEANPAMARLWGKNRQALVGTDLQALVAPGSRPHLARSLKTNHHTIQEAQGLRPDGTRFALEFITKPYVFQGRLVQVTGFRDITERKDAEAAQHKANELEVANERLVEIDRLKTHILNVTSHELNTPITPLRMQVHLLKNQGFGSLNERQRQSVEILDRNLERLSLLVKDILDVSRLEAGRLRFEPQMVEFTDLVQSLVRPFHAEAKQRDVRLLVCTTIEDWIEADPTRIEQAIVNVLSNALWATPPGGTVTLETQGSYREIRIEVRDTGIGLSPEQRARLFRPFDPVHNDEGSGGRGLGLYITKGIVEYHGGRIEVDSEGSGKGCRVLIALPKTFQGSKKRRDRDVDVFRVPGVPVPRPPRPQEEG